MFRKVLLFMLVLIMAGLFKSAVVSAEEKNEAAVQPKAAMETPAIPEKGTPAPEVATDGQKQIQILINSLAAENIKVTMSFAGDCTLGTDSSFSYKSSFPYVLAKNNYDFSYFFSGVKQIFQADDITLVNLETTFTGASKPAVKKFRFKGEPSYARILNEASIEAVNIANNHTMDYLQKGFEDTLCALEKAGVKYSGREYTPCILVKGVKTAFIGYTAWDEGVREKIKGSLEKVRPKADIIVVSLHWGTERAYDPGPEQVSLAHFCIDNGADAVIGHHPHVLQGVEYYKRRYIAYSLGNFCFGGNSNPADKDTVILRNEFELSNGELTGVKAEIMPCSISSSKNLNDYRPRLLSGKEKDRVLAKIKKMGWQ